MPRKNEDKIILHLCADIGSDSKPYKDAGYDVRMIGKDIGVENYKPPPMYMVLLRIRLAQSFLLLKQIQKHREIWKKVCI